MSKTCSYFQLFLFYFAIPSYGKIKYLTELKKCTFLIKKNLIAYEAERVTKTLEKFFLKLSFCQKNSISEQNAKCKK